MKCDYDTTLKKHESNIIKSRNSTKLNIHYFEGGLRQKPLIRGDQKFRGDLGFLYLGGTFPIRGDLIF